jgi:hypothetical protein
MQGTTFELNAGEASGLAVPPTLLAHPGKDLGGVIFRLNPNLIS